MSTIAVTGASGHLGRVLVPYLWERGHIVAQVGHDLPPDLDADVLIHAAAPNWKDVDAVRDFAPFNEDVARWSETTGGRVINVGSWWQYAPGATDLSYSRMKDDQQGMFPVTVIPFSIYGTGSRDGRGFIPQLVAHVNGTSALRAASREPRDWIHVRDVCDALRAALVAPDGVYEVATREQFTPAELLLRFAGATVPEWYDVPSCDPAYRYNVVPTWTSRIGIIGHLRRTLGYAA
jgi:nucleoside-diphosphate-sugar epimerase